MEIAYIKKTLLKGLIRNNIRNNIVALVVALGRSSLMQVDAVSNLVTRTYLLNNTKSISDNTPAPQDY